MGGVSATCATAPLDNCETRGDTRCRNRRLFHEVCKTVPEDTEGFEDIQRVAAATGEVEAPAEPTTLERQALGPTDGDECKLGTPTVESWSALTGPGFCLPAQRGDEDAHSFADLGLQGAINLPRGPQRRSVPTYATTEPAADLSGELRTGEVVQLRLGERIQKVNLTIYVDGFRVSPSPANNLQGYSRTWSPFTLIETCQVQVKKMEQAWAVFKLTILRRKDADMFYYFGCSGEGSEAERDRWVADISAAIGRVTLSLIPPHSITVRPVPGNSDTVLRLLAGYLMLLIDLEVVALYYCELQAYRGGAAKLALYQDEWCEHEVGAVPILNTSVVSTRKGEYCTVLGVDSSLLCARTWKEKELWLRAVSNVKVKLMFDAPEPTQEELNVYRGAVLARVAEVQRDAPMMDDAEDPAPKAAPPSEEGCPVGPEAVGSNRPILSPVRGKPKPCPRGDVWHPEPMDSPHHSPRDGLIQAPEQDPPPDFSSAFPPVYDGDDYPVPPTVAPNVKAFMEPKGNDPPPAAGTTMFLGKDLGQHGASGGLMGAGGVVCRASANAEASPQPAHPREQATPAAPSPPASCGSNSPMRSARALNEDV